MNYKSILFLLIYTLLSKSINAQLQITSTPRSFDYMDYKLSSAKQLPDLDNQSFERAIKKEEQKCSTCRVEYYGKSAAFELDLLKESETFQVPGGKIYRVVLKSPTAKALQIAFDDFYIVEGGELHFYTPDRKYVYGAFTSINNHRSRHFTTRLIPGGEVVIEYYEPKGSSGSKLNIKKFVHVFKELRLEKLREDGFESSGSCMVNVACNDTYSLASQAVARYAFEVETGLFGFCSGSLINNVGLNRKPYFLSAGHCIKNHEVNKYYSNLIFFFNYQSSECENPYYDPIFDGVSTMEGAYLRSYEQRISYDTDYALLELAYNPENFFDVAYLGWNVREEIPEYAINVSHPKGDIKKGAWSDNIISIDSKSESLESCHGKTSEAHVFELMWNNGRTAPGSSGSPLVNPNGQLVGVLEGGLSNCSDSEPNACQQYDFKGPDWFSELSYMWTRSRASYPTLQYVLAYNEPNRETMDPYDPPDPFPDQSGGGTSGWYENPCERDFGDGMSINYDEDSQVACVDGVIVMRPKKAQDDACWGAANPYWEIFTEDTDYSCNSIPSGVNDDLCSRRLLVPWKCRCYFAKYHITLTETNSSGTPIGPSYTKWFSVQSSDIKQRFYEISLTPQDAIDMGTQLKSGSYYVIRLKKEGSLSDVRIFRYMNQSTTIDYNPSQNVIANYKIEVENTTITNAVNIVARNSVKIKSGSVLKAGKYVSDFEMDCDRRSTFNLSRTIAGENMKNYTIPRPDEDELLEELEQSYSMLPSVSNTGLFQLHMTNSEICEVGVYDMNGRLVTRGVRVSDNDILIDVSSSQKGMFVVVIDGESSKTSKKIIYN